MTASQVKRFQKTLACKQIEFIPCENLIDKIWSEQPDPPMGKIQNHSMQYAGESFESKRSRICQQLKQNDIYATAITTPDSIAWFLNVRGSDVSYNPIPLSFLMIYADEKVQWFVDPQKLSDDLPILKDDQVECLPFCKKQFSKQINQAGQKGTIQLDYHWNPYELTHILEKSEATIQYAPDPIALPKAIKNQTEQDNARDAHRIDSIAWVRFFAWLDKQVLKREQAGNPITEDECVHKIKEFRAMSEYFIEPSFDTISAYGGNGALCHYRVNPETAAKLVSHGLYLIDSGGQYLGGTTDTTRVFPIGIPTDEQKYCYTLVLKSHIALGSAQFPKGTRGDCLDAITRLPLWNAGLDFDHGTGHGVGSFLSVHEGPHRISPVHNSTGFQAGMFVTDEPGYYRENEFGIRIENTVLVIEAEKNFLKFEELTLVPINKDLIVKEVLTNDEVQWLNNYHQKVQNALLHEFTPEDQEWLKNACSPL